MRDAKPFVSLSGQYQNNNLPKAMQKSSGVHRTADPLEEGDIIEVEDDEINEAVIEADMHRVANTMEVKQNVWCLDEALQDMMTHIEGGEVKEMLKWALEEFKDEIVRIMPQMMEADIMSILKAIKDPMCLTMHPQTEEV